jgi:hypothetical protein
LSDQVIRRRFVDLRSKKLRNFIRIARGRVADLHHLVEGVWPRVSGLAALQRIQIVEMAVPDRIGAHCGGKCVTPVFRDDNEAAQAELQRWVFSMQFAPDLTVAVVVGARVFG